PGARPIMAGRARIAANLRVAAARLAARIDDHASVVHREGREMCTRVGQACRERDVDTALLEAVGLIGWGEGLTPAGDDFLVGMLAGLDALVADSAVNAAFMTRFGAGLKAHAHRTTCVSPRAAISVPMFIGCATSCCRRAMLHGSRNWRTMRWPSVRRRAAT